MKLDFGWKFIAIIEIIGAIAIGGGIFLGGITGGIIAGVGALFLLVTTIKHFSEIALAGLIIGAILGGLLSYLLGNTADLFVWMFSGGMVGYSIGGNIFWWLNTRNRDEIFASFSETRSTVEGKMKGIEEMINEVGKYGISPTIYQKTLIHQKGLVENIRCNEKMVNSLKKAILSYNDINGNLDEISGQITQRRDLSQGAYRPSDLKRKKNESPYVKGSKWTLEKPGYEIRDSVTGATIEKSEGTPPTSEKEESRKKETSTELAPYESKRDIAIVPSKSYIEYIPPVKNKPAPSYVRNALPKYNIKNQVHSGSFSDIYEGTDSTGRRVSINVPQFKKGVKFNQATRDKFVARANGWKELQHENIVEVYDSEVRTLPHIITEPMDGGTLSSLMEKHSLTMEEAIHIMNKVLHGMSYAHENGVVHRNLNPENIFFTKGGAPKIGDWGIGKIMASGMGGQSSKNIYAYSAPEEFDKKEFGKIERRTDIFQLGIVFYEMLTGTNPFQDAVAVGSIGSIMKKKPKAPSSINPEIPPEIDELILKALEKSKSQRWESTDAMYKIITSMIG